MGRGASVASFLVLMAIIGMVAGSAGPETGKRNLLESLPKARDISLASAHTSEEKMPLPASGSWSILSLLDDPISVYCRSQLGDMGTVVLQPQATLSHQFPMATFIYELWYCTFKWDSLNGPMEQYFEVWAHDYLSFLWNCFDCEWRVQDNGFYFKATDGEFHLQWPWYPWNGAQ
ncbi:unnamed protein product [Calypogeia fissa]